MCWNINWRVRSCNCLCSGRWWRIIVIVIIVVIVVIWLEWIDKCLNNVNKLAYISNKEVSVISVKTYKSAWLRFKCEAVLAVTCNLEDTVEKVCKSTCFGETAYWIEKTCDNWKVLFKFTALRAYYIVYKTENSVKPILYEYTYKAVKNLCWVWISGKILELCHLRVTYCAVWIRNNLALVAICPCILAYAVFVSCKVFHNVKELRNCNHKVVKTWVDDFSSVIMALNLVSVLRSANVCVNCSSEEACNFCYQFIKTCANLSVRSCDCFLKDTLKVAELSILESLIGNVNTCNLRYACFICVFNIKLSSAWNVSKYICKRTAYAIIRIGIRTVAVLCVCDCFTVAVYNLVILKYVVRSCDNVAGWEVLGYKGVVRRFWNVACFLITAVPISTAEFLKLAISLEPMHKLRKHSVEVPSKLTDTDIWAGVCSHIFEWLNKVNNRIEEAFLVISLRIADFREKNRLKKLVNYYCK